MGKKAHLLRVGIDSAGPHKGHESKFLSSHFQKFSGPPPPPNHIRPSLFLSWVSPDRPPSLTLVLIHTWNTIETSGL